jgi:polyhydroxyalkanoate synthesis regulator phasin
MSDETGANGGGDASTGADERTTDDDGDAGAGSRSRRGRMGDGIRQGIGVLSAFKEALEETIQEARDRGDLSADRAKQVMREALDRAQSAAEDAKEKLDFAHQAELDEARAELAALRAGFDALQARVGSLEQSVFGESSEAGEEE